MVALQKHLLYPNQGQWSSSLWQWCYLCPTNRKSGCTTTWSVGWRVSFSRHQQLPCLVYSKISGTKTYKPLET